MGVAQLGERGGLLIQAGLRTWDAARHTWSPCCHCSLCTLCTAYLTDGVPRLRRSKARDPFRKGVSAGISASLEAGRLRRARAAVRLAVAAAAAAAANCTLAAVATLHAWLRSVLSPKPCRPSWHCLDTAPARPGSAAASSAFSNPLNQTLMG